MLTLNVVEEVRQLLEAGELSQRQIAAALGVSRGTVGAIASGKRGIYGRESNADESSDNYHNLPPTRCPGCGALVFMPCVLCKAREYRNRQRSVAAMKALSRLQRRVA